MGLNVKLLFGVSTSAFQLEGDDGTQGRGKSIWDEFCETKGKIFQGQNAKISTDHYNRYKEDVKLMAELGVDCYRFSISWSRIFPNGIGEVNLKGVEFYNNLIDELLKYGIKPFVTLFHWDLPKALADKGGLENSEFPKWFESYAKFVVERYGDKIEHWITFNEPINTIHSGYYAGVFAPGKMLSEFGVMKCLHHMLLAHGRASSVILSNNPNAKVGIAMSTFEEFPIEETPECIEATRKLFFEKPCMTESVDVYLDPLYFGKYPKRIEVQCPEFFEYVKEEDLQLISGKTNIIGYNNYGGHPINKDGQEVKRKDGAPYSDIGVPIEPNGIFGGMKFLYERYKKPVYITENGCACNDWVALDGKCHDPNRIEYFKTHLPKVEQAIKDGVDVRAYCVWSFLDNFEWLCGYSKRFGLVYVDYESLQRIPKDSYFWLKDYLLKRS